MSESKSLAAQYFQLIDQIVDTTLQGKIRSKEQVKKLLLSNISSGTGEIFERCLDERISATKSQLETKLKAARILRALETIQAEWELLLKENQNNQAIASASQAIISASSNDIINKFLNIYDPNIPQVLTRDQLQKLAQELKQSDNSEAQELGEGIREGLETFSQLESNLITWIYEQNQGLGFTSERQSPWSWWAKKVRSPIVKELFELLNANEIGQELEKFASKITLKKWGELVIVLSYLQKGLLAWFSQQPFDLKFGKKLSYSIYLVFAVIWCQLFRGLASNHQSLSEGCFKIMLQLLRSFARLEDFPLYGGVFASFSGKYLRDTLEYFDAPLRLVEGTQEKARILTLLGYSQMTLGEYERAKKFYLEALAIANQAKDTACEIANLNHLARNYVKQKDYDSAISYSQRALIFSRQVGDKLGQANALINLGYSEISSARQSENMQLDTYEQAISYLLEGLKLAEKLGDVQGAASSAHRQTQALAYNSLGIAYVVLFQPQAAINVLEKGIEIATFSGDVYLLGLNMAYLAQAYYSLQNLEKTVQNACLAMYLLEQIKSEEWRGSALLLTILREQLGEEVFKNLLKLQRPNIISVIGVDGYDYLPELLKKYR